MPFDLFLSAFVSLFVIVDPFGTAAVFVSLSQGMADGERKRIIIKGVGIAFSLIVIFSVCGAFLLHHMGISLHAFRVAGGLLLFITAFRMIMGYHDPDSLESKASYRDRSSLAVFPLAIPLLAGPGVLTATVMFTTTAGTVTGYFIVMGAITIVMSIALLSLLGAVRLTRFFGPTGNSIIARIMGILLAAMSVQFISDGARGLLGW